MEKQEKSGFSCKFLWNSQTGEFLGRTGCSWFKIFIFYVCFFGFLAAFFALMLYAFFISAVDNDKPRYTGEASLLGNNPSGGFRPKPDEDVNADSSLILTMGKSNKNTFWTNQLENLIEKDENAIANKKAQNCSFKQLEMPKNNKPCKLMHIEDKHMGGCTKNNTFGYDTGEPCVLVKLNRVVGFKPEPFGPKPFSVEKFVKAIETNAKMPSDLRDYIRKRVNKIKDSKEQEAFASSVFVSCDGENPIDRETIGPLAYYPYPYLPSYHFPYNKHKQYQSPYVMLQFERLIPGMVVSVECKFWAGNLKISKSDRTGIMHFQIMVDK